MGTWGNLAAAMASKAPAWSTPSRERPLASTIAKYLPVPQAASSTLPSEGSLDRNRPTKAWCIGSISPQWASKAPARSSSCRSSTRRRSRSQALRSAVGAPVSEPLMCWPTFLEGACLFYLFFICGPTGLQRGGRRRVEMPTLPPSSASRGTAAGSVGGNPSSSILRQQLDRDRLGGAGLVAQHVHVSTARVDEAVPCAVSTRRAAGVVARPHHSPLNQSQQVTLSGFARGQPVRFSVLGKHVLSACGPSRSQHRRPGGCGRGVANPLLHLRWPC